MKNILTTSNLTLGYPHKKDKKKDIIVAENCNLSLQSGKLIALIGANGIGKSTLLKTLTNIQQPISGTVFLNDKNINTYSTLDLAKNLSVVLTEKLPASNLTVFEIIALGRQPYTNWIGKLSELDETKVDETSFVLKPCQVKSYIL